MSAQSIQQLVLDNPRSSDGYPQHVRTAVADYARARRAEGARWHQIEAEVGVSHTSMRSWVKRPAAAGFHQVVVVPEPPLEPEVMQALTLTSPSGFALTGCTLEQAITALRNLR